MMWVVDASVAVRWYLKDETHPNADSVLRILIDHPESFAVPELFFIEAVNHLLHCFTFKTRPFFPVGYGYDLRQVFP